MIVMSINSTGPGGLRQATVADSNTEHNVGSDAPRPPSVSPSPTPISLVTDPTALTLGSTLDRLNPSPVSTRVVSSATPNIHPKKEAGLPIHTDEQLSLKQRILDRASGKVRSLSRQWDLAAPHNGMRHVERVRFGAQNQPLVAFPMDALVTLISGLESVSEQETNDKIKNAVYDQLTRLAKPLVNLAENDDYFFKDIPERKKLFALAFDYVATETPKFLSKKANLAEAMILTMQRLSKWYARDPAACEHFLKVYQPNLDYNICETEFMSKLKKYPGGFDPKLSMDSIARQNRPVSFDRNFLAKVIKTLGQPLGDMKLPAPNIHPSELAKHTSTMALAYQIAAPRLKDTRALFEIESEGVTIHIPIDGTFDVDRIVAENSREGNKDAFHLVDPLFDGKFLAEQNEKYMARLETCLDVLGELPLNVSIEQRKAVFLACANEIHTAMSDSEVRGVVARQLDASKQRFSSNARNDQPDDVIILGN
jgi:hypothetical protein